MEGTGSPFMDNTPSSSPIKKSQSANRVAKRPISGSSSASSLLSSPVRRPRSSNTYTDRLMPNRTNMDLNTVLSIGCTSSLTYVSAATSDNQLEFQKERQAHQTFDTILKNELFGDRLSQDADANEDNIERIHYTASRSAEGPSTPPKSNSSDHSTSSAPTTPKRLTFAGGDGLQRPMSNNVRAASLLTYRERNGTRNSTASLIHNQFLNSVSPVRPDTQRLLLSPGKKLREIAKVPYRVLDAPSLADDFYYDLIDWSSTDMLAVALGKTVFLTDDNSNEVVQLCETDDEYTSLSWVNSGSHLAVGLGNGLVELHDVVKQKCIRTLSGHLDRVACLSWNQHILSSGSRDHKILHRDVRMPEHYFETANTHSQEVCGLKWNVDENRLASGGNDNVVYVYDGPSKKPVLKFTEHNAAVKAMAWSPHRRATLATGGGTADRRLKIWNVNSGVRLNDVDTGSQVCNMVWSKNTDEIVTSHGYSKFNLTLWDCPTLEPLAVLKGHSFRVLHLTLSTDGTTIVSGAGDETLRYWKLFGKSKFGNQSDSVLTSAFSKLR
ncbi:AFL007Cp [Eremothecium gossypii ATCC 10895]|uniref:AFL007Cp n=1 Tax=Eremothecium gossypii (strain ATCC 10895 / CBS 109.51 / FGSC 9923 / NRRL Y-1056) TaxID=284811 RepID=Q754S8_EREGS|nr:AFL007Cp [Eremothecium gossypii ATCC 10895]AAS53365.2 AFL007Cp [Eremothecium gossypii ATCC 10895]AEY97676.1 FAFL007Cp [Eremothecium gossypii FDAG1]